MDTVDGWFKMTGRTITYAICPRCHCTYSPSPSLNSTEAVYPARCNYSDRPDGQPCDEILVDSHGEPFKSYVYHFFHDHVASLLSRADLREQFRRFRDEACRPSPSIMRNVQDGDFVRILMGQNGKPFMEVGERSNNDPEEFRLLWSLNVDGFQVEGANIHGVSRSATVISMACLSADGDTRFDTGVVYLSAVVPGEPGIKYIHHYIRPLVDQLLESWERGVRSTYKIVDPDPRSNLAHSDREPVQVFDSRSALAAIVADAPAGRSLMGLSALNSHHFCFVHDQPNLRFLGDTNFEEWQPLLDDILRQAAQDWVNATDTTARKEIWRVFGTRMAELWRLPYLRPTIQLVIEGMHGLFERICYQYTLAALQIFEDKKGNLSPGKVASYSFDFEMPPRPVDVRDRPRPGSNQDVDDADEPIDETQPNFADVDMDVDAAYDPDVAFGGAPFQERETDVEEEGPEADERRRQLQELRSVISAKECTQVLSIHRRLTIPLSEELHPSKRSDTTKTPRTPEQWLADGLSANNMNALRFVAIDLGLKVTPAVAGKHVQKADYGHALARWVRLAIFL